MAPIHLTVVVERPPCTLTSNRAKRECGEGRDGVKVRGRRWEEWGGRVEGECGQEK